MDLQDWASWTLRDLGMKTVIIEGKASKCWMVCVAGGMPLTQRMDNELVSCGVEKQKPAGYPETIWIRSIMLETSGC